MNQKKADYETGAPRPEDIKVTATKPTIEQLKGYRVAWLKEGEESGMIDNLFLIVNALGVRGEPVHRGWPPCDRYEFSDGGNNYVILLQKEVWGTMQRGENITAWEHIYVVENGEYMREIEYTNKRLVNYYRFLVQSPAQKAARKNGVDQWKIDQRLYIPGDWESCISSHLELAKQKLGKSSSDNKKFTRNGLLKDLNLI